MDPLGDAGCNIPKPTGRTDVMLFGTTEATQLLPFQLIDYFVRGHAVQIFDRDMERCPPGDERPGDANQVAMRIDQDVQSGR